MTFEASVREDGVAPVIDLVGDIDGSADAALNEAYANAVVKAPPAVLLNFADVNYINSTGIALIVGILAQARKTGVEVRAFGLTDHYKEIFEITRLAEFVSICADEASARAGGGSA